MKSFLNKYEKYLVPATLLILLASYAVFALISEGTHGGADDIEHYYRSRYAFQFPEFFLDHWGKPLFTALSSPFAQFGFKGIRIFNVLAGTLAAYYTYRTALLLKFKFPVLAIFLVISSPLYTVLMLSGMTEILGSLVLILSIFLFFKKKYLWSALVLSFMPFVRSEAMVIIPLFFVAFVWLKQWKAIPFLAFGFVFYSIVGGFHFDDFLWVINEMPYKGNAKEIYGSGELFHYVTASKFIFGLALAILMVIGGVFWILDPLLRPGKEKKEWLLEMLVAYLPFIIYLAAHSYVWWKGAGNSVGLIRVIVAVVPSAVLLGMFAYSRIIELIPVQKWIKQVGTTIFCIFLLTLPHQIYQIPVPLLREQRIVKDACDWWMESDYSENRFFYYNPFFTHFMRINPYDDALSHQFVHKTANPETRIKEGEVVIWDAHFSPNEGRLPLGNLMNNEGYKLIHLTRDKEPFTVLGGYTYEIYFFQRILEDDGIENSEIYDKLLAEIL